MRLPITLPLVQCCEGSTLVIAAAVGGGIKFWVRRPLFIWTGNLVATKQDFAHRSAVREVLRDVQKRAKAVLVAKKECAFSEVRLCVRPDDFALNLFADQSKRQQVRGSARSAMRSQISFGMVRSLDVVGAAMAASVDGWPVSRAGVSLMSSSEVSVRLQAQSLFCHASALRSLNGRSDPRSSIIKCFRSLPDAA